MSVRLEVKIFDVLGSIKRVRIRSWKRIDGGKRPSVLAHTRRHHGHSLWRRVSGQDAILMGAGLTNEFLEPFELTSNKGPGGPSFGNFRLGHEMVQHMDEQRTAGIRDI